MDRYCEHSITEQCKTNKDVLKKIYERAMETRGRQPFSYRPLTNHPHIDMVGHSSVDFAKFYPDYEAGDAAYISCYMHGLTENDMIINVNTEAKVTLYFNGEKKELTEYKDGSLDAHVTFKKGENNLLVRVEATDKSFKAQVRPFLSKLRMGPSYYVYNTWFYVKTDGFTGQEGFELSRLYRKNEEEKYSIEAIEWIFPEKPEQSIEKTFDFRKLCGSGKAAYTYTEVCGKITIIHKNPIVVFADGKFLCSEREGDFSCSFEKTTHVLIKSIANENGWGFTAVIEGECILSFVDGADISDLQWLWIGPFGRETDYDYSSYPPEFNLQFEEPYYSVKGKVYWNFYRDNTVLKQYMHSSFFGRWFYAQMVGVHGMHLAAQKLCDKDFEGFFADWIKLLCTHREYGTFDKARAGWASYLPIGTKLDRLDPVGTIGINVAEYLLMTGDRDAQYLFEVLSNAITHNVPRFPDGTFYRVETMWTDDTYMSLPFLARLGVLRNDESYFDDILKQVRGFKKRLYMEDEKLFSHIFFVSEKKANRVPWGRGNGWVLLALSEVLMLLPTSYYGYDEILSMYKDFAEGVIKNRDKKYGIWHQVVNNPDSYIEPSGSAMFITALARGVRLGWIDKKYYEDVLDAWENLATRCIDSDGNVYGICKGSGCNMEEKYYLDLETIVNDDHGVGIVLSACTEIMNMTGE